MAVQDFELKRIVKGCRDGNPEYQKMLYERFSSYMFSICMRYAHNDADAEDIFQEGFVKVFSNIRQLRNSDALQWWMRKIFVNEALMYYKNKTVLYRLDEVPEATKDLTDEMEAEIEELSTEELTEIIRKLPQKMRIVFNMYVIDGYSHTEISEKLHISVGTSKSNLHDARKVLQQKIRQYKEKKKLGS